MALKHIISAIASKFGYVVKRQHPARRRGRSQVREEAPSQRELMRLIHGKDIYEGFNYRQYEYDPTGWGSDSEAFARIFERRKPRFVVEVGSWKGGSAITMAREMTKYGGGVILCVDTWLGALEFWENQSDTTRFQALECRHGYPQVYYRFLANICHAGIRDLIVPFPLHSSSAALWLLRQGFQADAAYIDGSHEEEDVFQDLVDYYEIIRPGGLIFGDDWNWTGVRTAVQRFARENGVNVSLVEDKWLIEKPVAR